jgi:ketosteroid isomerase-like protein
MTLNELVEGLARAVEDRDGARMASLFTDDGTYHDVFYGAFTGKERIAGLVNETIYRHASAMRWEMFDPVGNGDTCYIRYIFSYISLFPEARGKRVGFEGVSLLKLRDGLIATYREIANTCPALIDIGFSPERVAKIAARQGASLRSKEEYAGHGNQA